MRCFLPYFHFASHYVDRLYFERSKEGRGMWRIVWQYIDVGSSRTYVEQSSEWLLRVVLDEGMLAWGREVKDGNNERKTRKIQRQSITWNVLCEHKEEEMPVYGLVRVISPSVSFFRPCLHKTKP